MHRVGTDRAVQENTVFNVITEPQMQKSNCISLISEIEKLEQLAYKIGSNLVMRTTIMGSIKKSQKKSFIVWVLILFLWLFATRVLICEIIIGDDQLDLLLLFGDLAPFYSHAVNRLYYNIFIVSWGFNAAIMYTLISRRVLLSINVFDNAFHVFKAKIAEIVENVFHETHLMNDY